MKTFESPCSEGEKENILKQNNKNLFINFVFAKTEISYRAKREGNDFLRQEWGEWAVNTFGWTEDETLTAWDAFKAHWREKGAETVTGKQWQGWCRNRARWALDEPPEAVASPVVAVITTQAKSTRHEHV